MFEFVETNGAYYGMNEWVTNAEKKKKQLQYKTSEKAFEIRHQ